jgi:hypothetical protein
VLSLMVVEEVVRTHGLHCTGRNASFLCMKVRGVYALCSPI